MQRLAELRNLKVTKKLSIDELEKLLITSVNLEQVHRELNNLNLFNTDNIKKAIDNLEKQIETKKKTFSNQLLRSYCNRIDSISSQINYLEERRQLKSEQDKITKALKLLRQKKLPIKSQEDLLLTRISLESEGY